MDRRRRNDPRSGRACESGTFADFDGYDGAERTDGTEEHDAWDLE